MFSEYNIKFLGRSYLYYPQQIFSNYKYSLEYEQKPYKTEFYLISPKKSSSFSTYGNMEVSLPVG